MPGRSSVSASVLENRVRKHRVGPDARRDAGVPERSCRDALDAPKELKGIINGSPVFVFLWRLAEGWPVDFVSDSVSRLGYTAEDFVSGRVSWPGITHPDDVPRLEKEVAGFLRAGVTEFAQAYRLITKSGDIRWVEDRSKVLTDANGVVTHIQGIVFDVTESKRAEEQVRESRALAQALLDATTEMAALVDVDGTLVAANAAMAQRMGKDLSEIVGSNMFDSFSPEVRKTRKARFRGALRSREPVRFQDERDGRTFDNNIRPVGDAEGKVVRFAVFARDITERRKVLEELQKANERLKAIAHTDDLTGLPNRRCFFDALGRELHRIGRYGGQTALAIVDTDYFKSFNDTYGHGFGDKVLVKMGALLQAEIRRSDTVARYAGDEFVLLMPSTSAEAAVNVIERIRKRLRRRAFSRGKKTVHVTFSAGVAAASGKTSPEALLRLADQALYDAKQAGRNCTRVSV